MEFLLVTVVIDEDIYSFICFLGKKDKLRVYYLSWLRNKILHNDPEVEKKQGWTTVGDLEGCVHYKVGESPRAGARFPGFRSVSLKPTCSESPRHNLFLRCSSLA